MMNERIGEQAVAWYVENLDAGMAEDRRQAFLTWLKQSPRHVQAYLDISVVGKDVAVLAQRMQPREDENHGAGCVENVVVLDDWRRSGPAICDAPPTPLPVQARPVARRYPRVLRQVAGLATFLLLAGGWLGWPQTQELSSGIGEQRLLILADNTRLHLDANSRVRMRIGWIRREIELLEGHSAFVVAEDWRPFLVQADGLRIKDIGTTFDVMLQPSGTRVSVAEGRVQVWKDARTGVGQLLADLSAGDVVDIARVGGGVRLSQQDTGTMLDWLEGKIEFHDERLEDVVARFNRFHPTPILIADERAAGLRVSGRLHHGDLSDLLEFLTREDALQVSRGTDGVTIRSR